jgi:hypothetical protein
VVRTVVMGSMAVVTLALATHLWGSGVQPPDEHSRAVQRWWDGGAAERWRSEHFVGRGEGAAGATSSAPQPLVRCPLWGFGNTDL